jgi:hypothetical protein
MTIDANKAGFISLWQTYCDQKTRIAELEKTLSFYADQDNYLPDGDPEAGMPISWDGGKKARAALEQ